MASWLASIVLGVGPTREHNFLGGRLLEAAFLGSASFWYGQGCKVAEAESEANVFELL